MFNIMTSKQNRENDDITGFGYRYDDESRYGVTITEALYSGISASSYRIVSFKPLSGLLNQEKWIPLRFCPLVIELELVNSATDAVMSLDGTTFTATDTSITWNITNPELKCDLCVLDNWADNHFTEHLLGTDKRKPGVFPINYKKFITQYQTITSWNIDVNFARAVSRLSAIFCSFNNINATFLNNNLFAKDFNTFYHPMNANLDSSTVSYDPTLEVEIDLSIGSKRFPEYRITSVAEAYTQLEKTIKDVYLDDYKSMSIRPKEWITNRFIIGINTSKYWYSFGSGYSTRNGDLIRVSCKPGGSGDLTVPNELHMVLVLDNVLEISSAGCSVYE